MTKLRDTLQRAMVCGAGVVRSAESLAGARAVVDDTADALRSTGLSVGAGELANLVQVADALLESALARTESRGAHGAAVPRHQPGLAAPTRARPGAIASRGCPMSAAEADSGYARAVADAVERALDEDLGPEGDLTAALYRPTSRRASRCVPGTMACWPGGSVPPRRSPVWVGVRCPSPGTQPTGPR